MRNKCIKILFLFLSFFILCCSEDKSNVEKLISAKNVSTLSDIFSISDSCYLDFPLEYFPSIIYDVAMNNSVLYIAGKSKQHPVVKFKKDGTFINTIGRIGGGPGEYLISPTRLSLQNNILAILLPDFNKIILYKDDDFLIEKYFPRKYRFSDLDFINDSTLIVSGYGSSEKHLLLMDIDLKLLATYMDIPNHAKIGSIISTHAWGIQCNDNSILSHFLYPSNIIQGEYNSGKRILNFNSKPLSLEKYQTVDSTEAKNMYSNFDGANRFKYFESISRLYWVMNMKDYTIGSYFYYGSPIDGRKMKRNILRLFVMQNNKIILERDLDRSVGFLIPHKNILISCLYINKFNDIKIKISQLSIIEGGLVSK